MQRLVVNNKLGRICFVTFCLLAFSISSLKLQAQNINNLLKKGQREYSDNNTEAGLQYFEEVLSVDRKNYTAAYFAGVSYLRLAFPKKALDKFSIIRPERFKLTRDLYYWLAFANFKNHDFETALEHINTHREKFKFAMREEFEALEASINSAQKFYADKKPFRIENLGDNINSENPEYSAVLTADHRTIHFTTRRKENKGGEKSGEYMEDILTSSLNENDQWSKASRLKGLSTVGHDATVQLYGDDKKMIIYQKKDLFITELENDKWSSPRGIGKNINLNKSRESHGFISKDGKTLIFSTDNKNKNGNLDLYISKIQSDGEWGKPRPINELNTDLDEDSPFIAEDGTLYFSSKGHNSMGGFDIYKSEYNPTNRKYNAPVNMGYPLNSVSDDIFFNVKNGVAYFTSSRAGGLGREDIYRAFLFENVNFSLDIVNAANKQPVSGAVVYINTGDEKLALESDASGKISTIVPAFQDFDVQVVKDGETLISKKLSPLTTLKDPENFNTLIEVNLQQKDNFIPESAQEEVIAKNNNVNNSNTQENDSGYKVTPATNNQSSIENTPEKVVADIKSIEKRFNNVSGKFILKRIYFNHNQATLQSESFDELDAVLAYLKQNTSIRAEIGGHTDNVGSREYNEYLSSKRAEAVVKYLIDKGIDSSRLEARGYGEARPIVSNDDEKEGREINRRIELKILKSGDGFSKNNQ